MKKHIGVLSGIFAALLLASPAEAGGFAVTARASTLGLGAELTAGLSDRVNVRVGGNAFSFTRSSTLDDDEYDLDLKFRSASALLDFHPTGGGFRLSGGLVLNGNEAGLVGRSGSSYEIGDTTYRASDVGALTGSADFNQAAAYAGIGFGNAVGVSRKVGLVFDLGVVFQGSPQITLGATGPIAGDAGFQQDLAQEELNFEADADRFKYYPVISLGISYKF